MISVFIFHINILVLLSDIKSSTPAPHQSDGNKKSTECKISITEFNLISRINSLSFDIKICLNWD